MKVCQYSFSTQYGVESRIGIFVEDNAIIDPHLCYVVKYQQEGRYNAYQRAQHKMPWKLSELLWNHDNPILRLQDALELYQQLSQKGITATKSGASIKKYFNHDIHLSIPLDKISTYRDFFTHEKHVKTGFAKRGEEIPPAWYEMPAYYKGPSHSFIGPNQNILWPSYSQKLDYELEMALIIGKEGINIKENEAHKHFFGFTILNDISARDIQKKEMSIRLGPSKGKDFCSVIGPVITTIDEFNGVEPNLLMTAKVNGEEWSRGLSGDAHYSWAEMLVHASQDEWILPCDLFGSGTVGTGCGLELDRWIAPNDIIELEIEKIGILKNKVAPPIQN